MKIKNSRFKLNNKTSKEKAKDNNVAMTGYVEIFDENGKNEGYANCMVEWDTEKNALKLVSYNKFMFCTELYAPVGEPNPIISIVQSDYKE